LPKRPKKAKRPNMTKMAIYGNMATYGHVQQPFNPALYSISITKNIPTVTKKTIKKTVKQQELE